MARILFSVSPIGLGHASRSIAIANELRKKGHEITFITGNISPPKFISAYGYSVKDIIKYPEFYVDKEGILKNTTLWMIKYILAYKRNKKEIIKSVNLSDFDLLISDEEFALASVAFQNSLPLVVISDIIGSQFARNLLAKYIEKRTNEWFYNFFREAPLSIIPEFEGPIEGQGVHYIGPIARNTNKTRDEIRSEWNFDDKKIILLTSSGSGIGSFLFRRTIDVFDKVQNMLKDQVELVVASPIYSNNNSSNTNSRRNIRFLGFVRDLHELIYASDLVITTAGKSTIDECLIYGTPVIAIPIKNHFEQERNARRVGNSYSDLKRLDSLILDKIKAGRRKPIRNNLKIAINLIDKMMN